MKKLFLIAALMFAAVGAFADDFDDFVRGATSKKIEGVTVCPDKAHRIVFFNCKLSVPGSSVTAEQIAEARNAIIRSLKNPDIPPDFDITLIYNFISTDGEVFPIVINIADLK